MTKIIIASALSALLATTVSNEVLAAETTANTQDMSQMVNLEGMEKCYGVARPGQNDCGTATHGCGGEAKIAGDKKEWIIMPKGLCNKIVGGSTKAS
ncbi:MAG: DUF2282 domain-containing protein [Gammaproteobacteria bacterium]|nr:DUF2282 domain-containing protein [Gammaproteobacteria bacterium]